MISPVSTSPDYAKLEALWRQELRITRKTFPGASVSGRFRGDPYRTGNGEWTYDSAGVRVICDDVPATYAAVDKMLDRATKSGKTVQYQCVHNLKGDWGDRGWHCINNPKQGYFKGVHVVFLADGLPVEFQFWSRRWAIVPGWAHGKIYVAERAENSLASYMIRNPREWIHCLAWLVELAEHYDRLDQGENQLFTDAERPKTVPNALVSWSSELLAGLT